LPGMPVDVTIIAKNNSKKQLDNLEKNREDKKHSNGHNSRRL